MNISSSNLLRQIKIHPHTYHFLKQYCRAKKQTLTDFYKEMMTWFIESYADNSTLPYRASYKNGKRLSLWLESQHVSTIHHLASKANVSDARVIFTALHLYIQKLPNFIQT